MTFFCSVLVSPNADSVTGNPEEQPCCGAELRERRGPSSTFCPIDQPAVPATAVSPRVIVPCSTVLLGSGRVPPWGTGLGLHGGYLAVLGGRCDPCQPLPSWVTRKRRVHWAAGGPHGSSQDKSSMNWTART